MKASNTTQKYKLSNASMHIIIIKSVTLHCNILRSIKIIDLSSMVVLQFVDGSEEGKPLHSKRMQMNKDNI